MILEELIKITKNNKGKQLSQEDSERCQDLIEKYDGEDVELNSWLNCSKLHPKIRHFILRRFLEIE